LEELMAGKKRVTFTKKNGKRVSFVVKVKPQAKKMPTIRGKQSTVRRRANTKVRKSTQQFAEAAISYAYPQYPLIKAGANLIKDILDH
jgi:hypothetical protein